MKETKLVIICGMSGAGKSTTSQRLFNQCKQNGIQTRWLHEEIRNHPIRKGEFGIGSIYSEEDMEKNIQDMYNCWKRLVKRILKARSVYILEGCLYEMHRAYQATAEAMFNPNNRNKINIDTTEGRWDA